MVVIVLIGVTASDDPSSSSTTSYSPPPSSIPVTGEYRLIEGSGKFGCSSKDYYKTVVGYAVQKDTLAFFQAYLTGCTALKEGEGVYITGTDAWNEMVRVRRRGETDEYWTARRSIR